MSDEPDQDFLWECVDALAGYSPADPKPLEQVESIDSVRCPRCGERVRTIREESQVQPIFGPSFGQENLFGAQRVRYILGPCEHETTRDEAYFLVELQRRFTLPNSYRGHNL